MEGTILGRAIEVSFDKFSTDFARFILPFEEQKSKFYL